MFTTEAVLRVATSVGCLAMPKFFAGQNRVIFSWANLRSSRERARPFPDFARPLRKHEERRTDRDRSSSLRGKGGVKKTVRAEEEHARREFYSPVGKREITFDRGERSFLN